VTLPTPCAEKMAVSPLPGLAAFVPSSFSQFVTVSKELAELEIQVKEAIFG
jgi:hypothetical protein